MHALLRHRGALQRPAIGTSDGRASWLFVRARRRRLAAPGGARRGGAAAPRGGAARAAGGGGGSVCGRGGGALLRAVALAAVLLGPLAARADAQPRIKVNCDVYATNRVDPIALSKHLHHQIGNTSTTNASTGQSLFNNTSTSCNMPWLTSAGWFPVERNEPVKGVNVYYRAPGDQTKIKAIPTGLQLLAKEQSGSDMSGYKYNCNDGPL